MTIYIGLFVKRVLDLVLSITGLTIASPILILLGIWIRLDSNGPVFYRGVRAGKDSKSFRMYKFRTMVVNADKIGGPSTSDDDPRLTKSGLLLRRYKLDELPQLINVVRGEMSLVGPRPEVEQEVAMYSKEEKTILSVKPGITDYASLKFNNEGEILAGSQDPHEAYRRLIRPEKMRLGIEYVQRRSLWVDLKILVLTFSTLFTSRLGGND